MHRRLVVTKMRAALPHERDALAIAILQRETKPALSAPLAVLPSGFDHVDAVIDGLTDDPDRFLLSGLRESRRAEREDRRCSSRAAQRALLKWGKRFLRHRRFQGGVWVDCELFNR